jgi:hypothetical protein
LKRLNEKGTLIVNERLGELHSNPSGTRRGGKNFVSNEQFTRDSMNEAAVKRRERVEARPKAARRETGGKEVVRSK